MVDETAPEPPGPGLSIAALAVATSTDAATITNLVASGLIHGPYGAGAFPRGDVSRIQLIKGASALRHRGRGMSPLREDDREL